MGSIIGLDPGKTGGAAIIDNNGDLVDVLSFTKATETDISEWLDEWSNNFPAFAYLEKVHSMPGNGVASMFKFGQGFGFLIGCLTSLKIPYEFVTPNKWQKHLGCQTKGDKNVTKSKAQQLFPERKMTHAIADAILIAEYGRRIRS